VKAQVDPVTDAHPSRVAAADLNCDGRADVALSSNSNRVQVFLGKADGTFTEASSATQPNKVTAFALKDVDGDGMVDVVTGDAQGNAFYTFLNQSQ